MDLFTMIVIIVAIVAFNKTYRYRMKTGVQEAEKSMEYLMMEIDRMEDRLANLETIVIEKESERRFANI